MIYFLTEDGNTKLKGEKFFLPKNVRHHLESSLENFKGTRNSYDSAGYKRLNNILNMNGIEYNEMKRLKNYFDTYIGDGNDDEYKLNGGDVMKNWVRNTLSRATKRVTDQKAALNFAKQAHEKVTAKPKRGNETAAKVVQAPTRITTSFKTPSLNVNNNEISNFHSVVKSPTINEKTIKK